MAVLSKEDFMSQISARVGDDTSDETLAFIENMTDTYNALEKAGENIGAEQELLEWESKYNSLQADYNELDNAWRDRYRKRFFSGEDYADLNEPETLTAPTENSPQSFDELFIEKEI